MARALLLHGLREMKALGMEVATVEHAADNLAALELYRGLGFAKKYETRGYRRVFSGQPETSTWHSAPGDWVEW